MGGAYDELNRAKASITATFEQEEERFRRTLGRGTALLEEAVSGLNEGDNLDGETAFKLYDTYGFPIDLTQDALRAKGLGVDIDGFDAAMERQKTQSREGGFSSGDAATDDVWNAAKEDTGDSVFTGYEVLSSEQSVKVLVQDGVRTGKAVSGPVMFLTSETPFYAESGGQAGDKGTAKFANGAVIDITDVQKKAGGLHVHIGTLKGEVSVGDVGDIAVDPQNRETTKHNHSATHILHEALRRVLGEHVAQKGQMVDGERIRFDISHGAAITREELAKVEDEVNAIIQQNTPAVTQLMSPDDAIKAGALALFGEKYGDEVRVLSLGDDPQGGTKAYSVELCGGTHVERTGDIALFKIVNEEAVAAGIRRVEAVTGEVARQYLEAQAGLTRQAADTLKTRPEDVPARIDTLLADRKRLEKELAEAKKQLALAGDGGAAAAEEINGVRVMARILEGVSGKELRPMMNEQLDALGSGIIAFVAKDEGKVAVGVAVSDDLIGQYSASDLVKVGAPLVEGRGGGKPGMAQAGGSKPEGAEEALAAIKAAI